MNLIERSGKTIFLFGLPRVRIGLLAIHCVRPTGANVKNLVDLAIQSAITVMYVKYYLSGKRNWQFNTAPDILLKWIKNIKNTYKYNFFITI